MKISKFIEENAPLERVRCYRKPNRQERDFVSAIEFKFANAAPLFLVINDDADELFWSDNAPSGLTPIDFDSLFPTDMMPYRSPILWVWEMKNQQGYFDAFQLEFASTGKSETTIFQFKAAASDIELHRVKIVRPNHD